MNLLQRFLESKLSPIEFINEEHRRLREFSTVVRSDSNGNYDNNGSIIIRVYHEPLGRFSFHVEYRSEKWEVVLDGNTFEIVEIKSKPNNFNIKKGGYLPNWIMRIIIKILKSLSRKQGVVRGWTVWNELISLWNTENPNFPISIDLEIE